MKGLHTSVRVSLGSWVLLMRTTVLEAYKSLGGADPGGVKTLKEYRSLGGTGLGGGQDPEEYNSENRTAEKYSKNTTNLYHNCST